MNNSIFSLYKDSLSGLDRDIWLLSLVMLVNRSGAMVVPFLSIYLNQQLGYTLGECGIIMAFYGVGAVLGVLSGGFWTDRVGFYKVQLFSLLFTSITFFVVMYCKSFVALCGGIFFISFFADHFRPANITAIETFSSKENLVRSITLVRLAINLGFSIGPFIGGLAIAYLSYDMLFILNGGSIFLAFLLFYFIFKDKQHKVLIKDAQEETADRLPWFDKEYMLFVLAYTAIAFVFLQLVYTYPLALKLDFLFNEKIIGFYMALNGIIICIVEMPLIYTLEKKYQPFPFANMFALEFSNDKNRGKYMGIFTMTFAFASIVSPLGGLKISEIFGFDMLWYFGFTIVLLAVGIMYLHGPQPCLSTSSSTWANRASKVNKISNLIEICFKINFLLKIV